MVTYEHVNEVVRNRCVKHKAKRWDSRATLLLIATSVGALIILIIKQTCMLMNWSGIDVINIKQREWIQGLHLS